MKIYSLTVHCDSIDEAIYLFKEPPARCEIIGLFTRIWRKLSENAQEQSWDLLLLAYTSPRVFWLGEFENAFGKLTCKVLGVIEPDQLEKEV